MPNPTFLKNLIWYGMVRESIPESASLLDGGIPDVRIQK